MLQDDKGESVREAVVKSLGILVAFIDDEDKFKQVHVFLPHLLVTTPLIIVLGVIAKSPQ